MVKGYWTLTQKLWNKAEKHLEKQVARQRVPHKRLDRFSKIFLEVCIGVIMFGTFLHIYLAPVLFLQGTRWEPAILFALVWVFGSFVFAGITTYKIMRMIHKHFSIEKLDW